MKAGAFLSATEAAERLGVSRQAVQQWITAGRLRAVRVGRGWIISVREAEKFAAARKEKEKPKEEATI